MVEKTFTENLFVLNIKNDQIEYLFILLTMTKTKGI